MIIRCQNCGKYHESLTICPELRLTFEPHKEAAPLPPTAEQTSIARFNALADQIRRHDQETDDVLVSIAGCLARGLSGLDAKLDRMAETQQQNYENLLRLTAIQWDSLSKGIKLRAVAKNKAAPLVGKKGTGRKG